MLRDYQIEMKTRLMEAWKAHRSVMVQMPTGTGKTHLLASVVSEFVSSAGNGVRQNHHDIRTGLSHLFLFYDSDLSVPLFQKIEQRLPDIPVI